MIVSFFLFYLYEVVYLKPMTFETHAAAGAAMYERSSDQNNSSSSSKSNENEATIVISHVESLVGLNILISSSTVVPDALFVSNVDFSQSPTIQNCDYLPLQCSSFVIVVFASSFIPTT